MSNAASKSDVVSSISRSGTTFTAKNSDGSTLFTFTQKDDDTVYTHPTTAGYKHIPSGGSSGQFLGWSSSGTASWQTVPTGTSVSYPISVANGGTGATTASAARSNLGITTYSNATTSSAGLMSSTDKSRLDSLWSSGSSSSSDSVFTVYQESATNVTLTTGSWVDAKSVSVPKGQYLIFAKLYSGSTSSPGGDGYVQLRIDIPFSGVPHSAAVIRDGIPYYNSVGLLTFRDCHMTSSGSFTVQYYTNKAVPNCDIIITAIRFTTS